MRIRIPDELITLAVIAALGLALVNSAARADNAPDVAMPAAHEPDYTFDNVTRMIDEFIDTIGPKSGTR